MFLSVYFLTLFPKLWNIFWCLKYFSKSDIFSAPGRLCVCLPFIFWLCVIITWDAPTRPDITLHGCIYQTIYDIWYTYTIYSWCILPSEYSSSETVKYFLMSQIFFSISIERCSKPGLPCRVRQCRDDWCPPTKLSNIQSLLLFSRAGARLIPSQYLPCNL